jgi:UDP-glucose 4-epimerase
MQGADLGGAAEMVDIAARMEAAAMKIVVTGGSGLFGQQVIADLTAHGHEVVNLDRKAHPAGYQPTYTADLTDPKSFDVCAGAGGLVHLAAYNAPNLTTDQITFNNNVSITYNALKAAAEFRVPRAVIASSLAAYGFLYGEKGRTPHYLPIDEEHPCRPTDPYGLSKVVGEMLADAFALSHGMGIASLRLPGINYDPAFARIKEIMQDPGFRRTGFWTYIDVRDAAAAIWLALEQPLRGHRVFNVAAPGSNMKEPTAELIRRFFPELKDVRNRNDTNWSGMDSTRIERELGFRPQYRWEQVLKD